MDDFGDTRQGDLAGSRADPGSSEAKMDVWWGLLSVVAQNLERLEIGLAAVREEISRLEAAGIYPAVPTESWEGRNGGETRYLRMIFPVGTPGVRRKEYVGCQAEAITEARRLVLRALWSPPQAGKRPHAHCPPLGRRPGQLQRRQPGGTVPEMPFAFASHLHAWPDLFLAGTISVDGKETP